MAIIRKSNNINTANTVTEDKNAPKKRESGLGRGLGSLLEDNSPGVSGKSSVVRRTDDKSTVRTSDDLYKKDGVKNVKKSTWVR
jgi:hypothetical protein